MPFDRIDDDALNGEKRGYWGTVVDARRGWDDALWLNSGTPGDPSVVLEQEIADEFLEDWGVGELEDLAGAWVLALGTFGVSHRGKRYIGVESARVLAVRFAE